MVRPLARDQKRIDGAAEMLKALGHPLRLRIVAVLSESEEHVNALAERVDAPPAIVSQQLRILRMEGLVAATRESGQAVYRVIDPRVRRLLDCMESHGRELP